MEDIFIWRKSIQKKKGHCPKCGSLLVKENGYPTDNVCVDESKVNNKEFELWCLGCRSKGIGYIVGVRKSVDDATGEELRLAHDMFGSLNWDEMSKYLNKKARDGVKTHNDVKALERTIKQQEFTIGMLKGSIEQIKTKHEKEIKEKDKQILELTKEIKSLEADLKRMEERGMSDGVL